MQRYKELYVFAPIAYVSFDRAGRIQEINSAAAKLLRKSRRTLLGKPFAVCVSKDHRSLFLSTFSVVGHDSKELKPTSI